MEIMKSKSVEQKMIRNQYSEWSIAYGSREQQRLYLKWIEFNRVYFNNSEMLQPIIEIGDISTLQTWGCYFMKTPSGITGKITIRRSIVSGRYVHLNLDADPSGEGLNRFVDDILLHEMIHQYAHEVIGKTEESYSGHGPVFKDECNRIGEIIGLPSVRDCKRRGRYAELPSCAHWPHNVRPADYYKGIYQSKKMGWGSDYSILRVPSHLLNKVESYIEALGTSHA